MTPFGIQGPGQILFGRGEVARAPRMIAAFGRRGILVHGGNPARGEELNSSLARSGCDVLTLSCASEPTLPMLNAALVKARPHAPDWVAAIGGGAVLDLGKALAALIPSPHGAMDHLEGLCCTNRLMAGASPSPDRLIL